MAARRPEGERIRYRVLPPPEHCVAAAVLQGFAVMLMCTALSDPSWVVGQAEGQAFVFGVPYVLHLGLNLTETGPLHLLHERGLNVLVLMATCCYVSILFGMAAFLIDFLDTSIKRLVGVKVAPILHITTALSTAGAVGLSSYLFTFILQELRLRSLKTSKNTVTFGESYFFAIFSGIMSLVAASASLYHTRRHRRGTLTRRLSVEADDASAPLLHGEHS
uniref:Transmembrane protein 127 transmembrane region domain-containing protein n=1 Tax=Leptobrachium leishanense TaxID=445787 RepID=A0A8C5N1L2_9ANUR